MLPIYVTMRRLIPPFHAAVAELTAMVDADARAFEAYLVRVQWPPPLALWSRT